MATFTFNGRERLGWSIRSLDEYRLITQSVAFIIYLEPTTGVHHFTDGPFRLGQGKHSAQYKSEKNTTVGTIMFAMASSHSVIPTILFRTKESYIAEKLPTSIELAEYDLEFYDNEALRDMIHLISNQRPSVLLPYADSLFQIMKDVEEERISQQQQLKKNMHDSFLDYEL